MCFSIGSRRGKEITMANERGDAAGYLGWFLFGSAIGAVAAVLLTPKTGQEARDILSEKSNEWARRAQEAATEAQGRAAPQR
jgi:gas vesicle protein